MNCARRCCQSVVLVVLAGCGADNQETPAACPPGSAASAALLASEPSLPGYAVSGVVEDYETRAALTAPTKLATQGLAAGRQAETDGCGPYALVGIPEGSVFFVRATATDDAYLATTNPAVWAREERGIANLSVVSRAYRDRQYATADLGIALRSTMVIVELEDDRGAGLAGLPHDGLALLNAQNRRVGLGPYNMSETGILPRDPAAQATVADALGRVRVAFLNAPAGVHRLVVAATREGRFDRTATAVVAPEDGVALAKVVLAPVTVGRPAFAEDIYPMLQRVIFGGLGCASCHTTGGTADELVLDVEVVTVHERLLRRQGVVQPATPEESLLLTRPLFEDPPDHPNATWLTDLDPNYQRILAWIRSGAPLH